MGEGTPDIAAAPQSGARLARRVLAAFVLTFLASRVLVLLIITHRIPDLYLHVGGTHVHHLNYGIYLLSAVGAVLLFRRPEGRALELSAYVYGVGLALTFDEFGMWLHLGGSYWQRASFDAVVVVAAGVGLIAAAPAFRGFRTVHWLTSVAILVGVGVFAVLLVESLRYAGRRLGPSIRRLEQ